MKRPRQMVALWVAAVGFTAVCLWLATCSGPWLEAGPRFEVDEGSLVIEGSRLRECLPEESDRVGALADGVRLYADVDLTFRVATTRESSRSLFLVARGRPAGGVWPLLTLHVDGDHRAGFFVGSRDWRLYRVGPGLASGEHHVRLSYVNDRVRFPADRDLDLRLVGLGTIPPSIAAGLPAAADLPPEEGALPLRLGTGSHVVTAHDFDLDSGSIPQDGGRTLGAGAYLGRTVLADDRRRWRVHVSAWGESCEGRRPRLLLMVGEEQIGSWDVGATEDDALAVDLELRQGTHEIFLVHDRHGSLPEGCDPKLHVGDLGFAPSGPALAEDG